MWQSTDSHSHWQLRHWKESCEDSKIRRVTASFLIQWQLAVALARHFNGECINFDALQLYKGLPIATNKIRPNETHGVPHHLLACVDLREPTWTVSHFASAAENAIKDIQSRGKLPILVGGTHYYVQALLFQGHSLGKDVDSHMSREEMATKWPILREGHEAILWELRRVDPEMASRWHPKDDRKIRRSLEIWLETGDKPSDIYAAQRKSPHRSPDLLDGQAKSGPLASSQSPLKHESLVFWLHCDQSVLDERLRERVDCMIKQGLLEEISELHSLLRGTEKQHISLDNSKGIESAIGYKEFEHYLNSLDSRVNTEEKERLKAEAIEQVKVATRQYAKRQTRWIRQKLLPDVRTAKAESRLFLLDCTEGGHHFEDVENLACSITDIYLAAKPLPDPKALSLTAASILSPALEQDESEPFRATTCQLCDLTVASRHDWGKHVIGRRHKATLRRERKFARQAALITSDDDNP